MGSFEDRYGLSFTTASAAAAAAYLDGVDRLISYDGGVEERLVGAIAADPTFALAHAALATLRWQRRRNAEAAESAERAELLVANLPVRERQHVAVVLAAIRGHGYIDDEGHEAPNHELVRLARGHLDAFPRDALVLMLLTIETVFCGDPRERGAIVEAYERMAAGYDGDWWFVSWRAICEIEVGRLGMARGYVDAALASNRGNPIAAHGYGHVEYESGDFEAGAESLGAFLEGYDSEAMYHSHVAWHYSMLDLMGGRTERALATYRRAIDPAAVTPARTTLADSVNFLWRCELAYPELAAELPWAAARDHAVALTTTRAAPQRDVLAGAAFIGAGDRKALAALRQSRLALDPNANTLTGALVLPLLDGLQAFADEDYARAARVLERLLPKLYLMGGSAQQRDMYEETLTEARLRASGLVSSESRAAARAAARAARRHATGGGEG